MGALTYGWESYEHYLQKAALLTSDKSPAFSENVSICFFLHFLTMCGIFYKMSPSHRLKELQLNFLVGSSHVYW